MKWLNPFSITFVVFVLPVAVWLVNIAHLTRAGNRACHENSSRNQPVENSPINKELQSLITDYSAQHGGIGLQVTVIFPDGWMWNGTSGYADISNHCPLTLRHHLYLGSMTKLFTAALIMEQVEKGTLTLDDPVGSFVFLPYAEGVTLRHLLNHTSGLPDYARDTWFQIPWFGLPGKTWRPDELVRVIQNKPLWFKAGSLYEYSNSNYLLLGMILEKAVDKPFHAILDETLLAKLGLQDTFFLAYPDDIPLANGYDESLLHLGRRNLTGFRRSLESGAYAAGGILSTSQDVARYVRALFHGRVVSRESLAEMKTFTDAPDPHIPEQTGYGLGIRRLVIEGEVLLGHTGSIPGCSGIAMHNEQKGYTIVILSNLSTVQQTGLLAEIQRTIQNVELYRSSLPGDE